MDPDGRPSAHVEHPYRPIDCSFHDRLESLATLGTVCRIAIRGREASCTVTERITDVFAHGGEEFLTTPSTGPVRLDLIESVEPLDRAQ